MITRSRLIWRPPRGLAPRPATEAALQISSESLSLNLTQQPQLGSEKSLLARHEALFRVSRAINVYRDPRELFKVLALELRDIVDFDFVALFFYDQTTNKIQNAVLETLEGPGLIIPSDFPAEETITWWVYQHQEPVLVLSRDEEVRFPRMMKCIKATAWSPRASCR